MPEKTIKMQWTDGRVEDVPVSEVSRRKFYGWKVAKETAKKTKNEKPEVTK